MIGHTLEVLLEEEIELNGEKWYVGHSREYVKLAVRKSEEYGVNDIISVKAEKFLEEHLLTGKVLIVF